MAETLQVMDEQYEYLTDHLQLNCQIPDCGDCKRVARLKAILLESMETVEFPWHRRKVKVLGAGF